MKAYLAFTCLLFIPPYLFSQGCLPSGITFTTQNQVDLFPLQYPGCIRILGNVTIFGSDITHVDSLYALQEVVGDLYLTNNENLQHLHGLRNLERVGGACRIQNNPLLEDLDGLSNLQVIAGDYFYLGSNTRLATLQHLTSLDSVMGIFQIWGQDSLLVLDGLNALHFVGNDLSLFDNAHLQAITGFSALAHVVGGLRLNDHPQLADISAFDHPLVIEGPLVITQNPQLGNCAVTAICEYLALPPSFIAISDNANGCQDEDEVRGICLSDTEHFSTDSPLVLYPNPAQEVLHLQRSGDRQGGVAIWNSQSLLMARYPDAPSSIDIGDWPKGVYWLQWETAPGNVGITRFIKM